MKGAGTGQPACPLLPSSLSWPHPTPASSGPPSPAPPKGAASLRVSLTHYLLGPAQNQVTFGERQAGQITCSPGCCLRGAKKAGEERSLSLPPSSPSPCPSFPEDRSRFPRTHLLCPVYQRFSTINFLGLFKIHIYIVLNGFSLIIPSHFKNPQASL